MRERGEARLEESTQAPNRPEALSNDRVTVAGKGCCRCPCRARASEQNSASVQGITGATTAAAPVVGIATARLGRLKTSLSWPPNGNRQNRRPGNTFQ